MCSPGAGALALTVYGMEKQGDATAEEMAFNAMTAEQQAATLEANAALLDSSAKDKDSQAEDAGVRGDANEGAFRTTGKQISGQQTAQMGGSGFEVDSGSNVQLKSDLESNVEADALTIRYNADMEKYGLHEEAQADRDTAEDYRKQAGYARDAAKYYKRAGRNARNSKPSNLFGLLG